jgi:predicted GNAT family acetyltransferase
MAEREQGEITLNSGEERWELKRGADEAFLSYARDDGLLYLTHTEVPPAFRGEGLGQKLVVAAMDFARAEHLTVVPFCPFAKAYLQKHRKDYEDMVRWGD